MRRITAIFMLLGLTTFVSGAFGAQEEGQAWFESFESAQAHARESNKPVLALFTGSDWCAWCIKLEKEVFGSEAFSKWAGQNVVLAMIDFPRRKQQAPEVRKAHEALAEKHGIEGFPTVLFLSSDGAELGRMGYEQGGPDAWTRAAQKLLERK
jgi:protein disulfide-isomerase